MTLRDLRLEYERETIGPAILEEVRRVCAAQARRYPPAVYARSHSWGGDAVDELVQDVVVERLLGEQQLAYIFDAAVDLSHWRALLTRQVKITLARRRVRTVVDNLLERAGRRLAGSEEVETITFSGNKVFRRVGAQAPYRPLADDEVRRVVERVRALPRRRPGRGERAPSVYSGDGLAALLDMVLREAPGGVAVRDLGRIFESVLTDWVPAVLELEETDIGSGPSDMEPGEAVEVKMLASQIVSGLSEEETQILLGYLAGLPYNEVAGRVGVSTPTLIKRRHGLLDRIRAAAGDLDEAAQDRLMDEIALATMMHGNEDGSGD